MCMHSTSAAAWKLKDDFREDEHEDENNEDEYYCVINIMFYKSSTGDPKLILTAGAHLLPVV